MNVKNMLSIVTITSNNKKIPIYLIATVFLLQNVGCEVYTSMEQMHDLLDVEDQMIQILEASIMQFRETVRTLESEVIKYKAIHEVALKDPEKYVSHPINAFALIKRLVHEWDQTVKEAARPYEMLFNEISTLKGNFQYPVEKDLQGAIAALMRLQKTYNISNTELINGNFKGIKVDERIPLSAYDCLDIAFAVTQSSKKIQWLNEALKLAEDSDELQPLKISIITHLAHEHFNNGQYEASLQYVEYGLKQHPDNDILLEYKESIGNHLTITKEVPEETEGNTIPKRIYLLNTKEMERYEKTCSGTIDLPLGEKSKLKCYYSFGKGTKILRYKVEESKLNPDITLFHDVIYDSEIQMIKDFAKPRLERAQVATLEHFDYGEDDEGRISKNMWIMEDELDVTETLNRRLEDVTGLCMSGPCKSESEPLQVANYGLAGQYEPHVDFKSKYDDMEYNATLGNRIATIMFYLSDVPAGGKTAFPLLKVAVAPVKGAAVMWYNLYRDGQGDYSTVHAACPVIVGSKWVANKWIREHAQAFIRPCNLTPDSVPDSEWIKLMD